MGMSDGVSSIESRLAAVETMLALMQQAQEPSDQPPPHLVETPTISGGGGVPIGSIVFWKWGPSDEAHPIPDGWQECTELQGKVPFGFKADDDDFGAVGDVGGTVEHTHDSHATHDHALNDVSTTQVPLGSGGDPYITHHTVTEPRTAYPTAQGEGDVVAHTTVKHINPGYVGCWIERVAAA